MKKKYQYYSKQIDDFIQKYIITETKVTLKGTSLPL